MAAGDEQVSEAAARIEAFREQARQQVRAGIGTDLAAIQAQFRADVTAAGGSAAGLRAATDRAAASLRALRPAVAAALRDQLPAGAALGASLAGGQIPAGHRPGSDPAVKVTLNRVNTPIRRHARASARAIRRMPLRTDAQIEAAVDRIAAVLAEVDAATDVIVSRAVDAAQEATLAASGGDTRRVWVTNPGCCPSCAAHSGAVVAGSGLFVPVLDVADTPGQWQGTAGIPGPPLHAHCSCFTVPWARGIPERLTRQAEADIAAGRVAASMPARIRAVERLLALDRKLTQRTRQRAQTAAARGRFGAQRTPATQRRDSGR